MDKQVQRNFLRRIRQPQPVKVIAVCSGKGGVGKTNVATNLAVALSGSGENVMLLDADLSLANVDVLLGLQPRFNLSHVLSGEAQLEDTLLEGPQNLRIVPASSGNFELTKLDAMGQSAIIHAFGKLADQPDILVVDTAAGISPGVARFVQAAQYPLVVVRDEPASLTDAYALIKVFSRHYGIDRFQVVTNQSNGQQGGRRLFGKLARVADGYLDVVLRHAGDVPDDPYLGKAVQQQCAVVDAYPGSSSGQAFKRLAEKFRAMPHDAQANGGLQFFLERLVCRDAAVAGRVA
jgi:flagellar biosynthesis protein FlhG